MKIDELNSTLSKKAIDLGLCQQWQQSWNGIWDKQKMIEKFFEGIDFCLMYRYPSYEFIKNNFDRDLLRKNSILLDDKYSLLNPKESVLFGKSESTIRFNARNHGTVYLRDNSTAKIKASGKSFVLIHLLDDCYVTVEKSDEAKVILIKHSEAVTIVAETDVEIREEYDWLK